MPQARALQAPASKKAAPSIGRAPKAPASRGGLGAGGSLETVDQQGTLGNGFLGASIGPSAGGDVGVGGADLFGKAMFGEHKDKYKFAEGPEDKVPSPAGGGRMNQKAGLPGLRDKHTNSPYEDQKSGAAFVKGEGDKAAVDSNDVRQGQLGDCYLMAGMASVARANPELIQKLIKDNGDGTFDVTLYLRDKSYSQPRPVVQTIDAQLAVKALGGSPLYANIGDTQGGSKELWPALLEKAMAQKKGSYDKISGGNVAKDGFNFAGAIELFTGKRENYFATDSLQEDDVLLMIGAALEAHKPITVDTRNLETDAALTQKANGVNVYWNHAYSPMKVDIDARTIDLQNPWGSNHVTGLSIKDFVTYYRSVRVGA
jgi:hypothetical protein